MCADICLAENAPSAQFVCPSSKVLDFNAKRLHWTSVVRVYLKTSYLVCGTWTDKQSNAISAECKAKEVQIALSLNNFSGGVLTLGTRNWLDFCVIIFQFNKHFDFSFKKSIFSWFNVSLFPLSSFYQESILYKLVNFEYPNSKLQ